MKTFKTQKEIYQALFDGKKIIHHNRTIVYMKDDGFLNNDCWSFYFPEDWSVYCEPHEPEAYANVCKHCGVKLKIVWVGA